MTFLWHHALFGRCGTLLGRTSLSTAFRCAQSGHDRGRPLPRCKPVRIELQVPALKVMLEKRPTESDAKRAVISASAPDAGAATEGSGRHDTTYDWQKRDPVYAHAEATCLWELTPFLAHFHPSVRQFANSLRNSSPIEYGGDPLRDFQLTPFLDKFVFKNPKQKVRDGGAQCPAAHPPIVRTFRG